MEIKHITPNSEGQPSNSIVRLEVRIENILALNDQLTKRLDALNHPDADDLYVYLGIDGATLKITIQVCDAKIGVVTLSSSSDQSLLTVDTILQDLEGGNPGVICIANWDNAIAWICDLVVRLRQIESFWTKTAITEALERRANRMTNTE